VVIVGEHSFPPASPVPPAARRVRHAGRSVATLVSTMETMHPAGRRRLPPVPRAATEPTGAPCPVADAESVTERFEPEIPEAPRRRRPPVPRVEDAGPATERFVVELSDDEDDALPEDAADDVAEIDADAGGPPTERFVVDFSDEPVAAVPALSAVPADDDPAQDFVTRLRSSAGDFAEAAGATSAVVREAVPPARHRRARCRVVLRYADDTVTDVTFLGSAGSPGRPSRHGFDRQIRRWLGSGQRHSEAWVVADPEASGGLAVDVAAWVAAG
jgi:hypothetical protein